MKLEKITINRKHEMFWNLWVNLNSFLNFEINRKHEMFWNWSKDNIWISSIKINRKHEMFWNGYYYSADSKN